MTVADLTAFESEQSIIHWRFSQLTRSGYGFDDAITLAARFDIDLHIAADLVSRGCPPRLALRILL
jgi:hypothetical protein